MAAEFACDIFRTGDMTHVFGNGDSVFEREAGSNGRVTGTAVSTEVNALGSRMPLRDVRVRPR